MGHRDYLAVVRFVGPKAQPGSAGFSVVFDVSAIPTPGNREYGKPKKKEKKENCNKVDDKTT